jgi:hypothetical protein
MNFLKKYSLTLMFMISAFYFCFRCSPDNALQDKVFMGTGTKIGEVTQNSAIIWTRLTKVEEADTAGIKFNEFSENDFLENTSMDDAQNEPEGGFLAVSINRPGGISTATFRHYGATGQLYNEDIRRAQM